MLNEFNDQEEIKSDNEFESFQNQVQPYSRNQKIAVGVLAFFGIFVLIFWAVQFKSNLKKPFQYNNTADVNSNSADTNANSADFNADDEALKTKDTDGDGLNDWDELHVYLTSPYLEDTDGDGYNDKQEIDTGNDPNCPRGQTCANTETNTNNSKTIASSSGSATGIIDSSLVSPINTDVSTNNTNASPGANGTISRPDSNADAKTIRAYLEQAGFNKEMLNGVSDEDLIKTYQQTLQTSAGSNAANTSN
jgi:hypothetical protein